VQVEQSTGRSAPNNLEAEASVLSAMLIDEESLAELVHLVQPEDFYKPAHQHIAAAIQTLAERQERVDHVTLAAELEREGKLEDVGGRPYVFNVSEYVPTAASARYHADIVRNHGVLRRLISTTTEIANRAFDGRDEAMVLLDDAERQIFEIARKGATTDPRALSELLLETFERIDKFRGRNATTTGVPTGYVDLDAITAGLQPGELTVVASRPSMGKTSFALNLLERSATEGYGTAFFSLEMSSAQVMQNLLCCRARVNAHNLRRGRVSNEDYRRLKEGSDGISDASVFIDDATSMTPLMLRAKSRRLKQKHNIQMVIVDYLQLMTGGGKYDNRALEIAMISRSLKGLAKELQVPVIAISQLNRGVENRDKGGHRPRMSDLRESGAIEQDADVIMLLHREDYYQETEQNRGLAEVIVAKQRNGPTGSVKLRFFREFMRFESFSGHAEPVA
jgi:replicative DNA helicase